MNWNAYVASSALSVGASVEVSRYLLEKEAPTTPAAGDHLFIKFPNNDRAGGDIQTASDSSLVVSVSGSSQNWEQQGSSQVKAGGLLTLAYIVK